MTIVGIKVVQSSRKPTKKAFWSYFGLRTSNPQDLFFGYFKLLLLKVLIIPTELEKQPVKLMTVVPVTVLTVNKTLANSSTSVSFYQSFLSIIESSYSNQIYHYPREL